MVTGRNGNGHHKALISLIYGFLKIDYKKAIQKGNVPSAKGRNAQFTENETNSPSACEKMLSLTPGRSGAR